ncbi:MAG TPA: DUF6343 family protein [Micromonosporaceae bacterium]|jgi:hypothetical protein|nr:DUF6343 family protein [Micromonosporaceae bacterium]
MPIGPQPRGARGTFERPYSALRLRLALAILGVVICVAGGVLMWMMSFEPLAFALFVVGAMAVVDLVVISVRLARGGGNPPAPPPPPLR